MNSRSGSVRSRPSPSRSATWPADETAGAAGRGDLAHDLHPPGGRDRVRGGENLEGLREQGVAGEDREGLAEDLVRGRPPAADVVVVHRRQVVVDQRVGVDHLDGRRHRQRQRAIEAAALRRGEGERRAQALAAPERAVADRLGESRQVTGDRREHPIEKGLDQDGGLAQIDLGVRPPDRCRSR